VDAQAWPDPEDLGTIVMASGIWRTSAVLERRSDCVYVTQPGHGTSNGP